MLQSDPRFFIQEDDEVQVSELVPQTRGKLLEAMLTWNRNSVVPVSFSVEDKIEIAHILQNGGVIHAMGKKNVIGSMVLDIDTNILFRNVLFFDDFWRLKIQMKEFLIPPLEFTVAMSTIMPTYGFDVRRPNCVFGNHNVVSDLSLYPALFQNFVSLFCVITGDVPYINHDHFYVNCYARLTNCPYFAYYVGAWIYFKRTMCGLLIPEERRPLPREYFPYDQALLLRVMHVTEYGPNLLDRFGKCFEHEVNGRRIILDGSSYIRYDEMDIIYRCKKIAYCNDIRVLRRKLGADRSPIDLVSAIRTLEEFNLRAGQPSDDLAESMNLLRYVAEVFDYDRAQFTRYYANYNYKRFLPGLIMENGVSPMPQFFVGATTLVSWEKFQSRVSKFGMDFSYGDYMKPVMVSCAEDMMTSSYQLSLIDDFVQSLPQPQVYPLTMLEMEASMSGCDDPAVMLLSKVGIEECNMSGVEMVLDSPIVISTLPNTIRDSYQRLDYEVASNYHPIVYSKAADIFMPEAPLLRLSDNYTPPKTYAKGKWMLDVIKASTQMKIKEMSVFEPSAEPFGFGYAFREDGIPYSCSVHQKNGMLSKVAKDYSLRYNSPISITGDVYDKKWVKRVFQHFVQSKSNTLVLDLSLRTHGYREKDNIERNFRDPNGVNLMIEDWHDVPFGRARPFLVLMSVYNQLISVLPMGTNIIMKIYDPIINHILKNLYVYAKCFEGFFMSKFPFANPIGREFYIFLTSKRGVPSQVACIDPRHFVHYFARYYFIMLEIFRWIICDATFKEKYRGTQRPILSRSYLLMIK